MAGPIDPKRTPPSADVVISTSFDRTGINPETLVGKKIVACSHHRYSALILEFSDQTKIVLRHRGIFGCEKEYYAQPFLILEGIFDRALEPFLTGGKDDRVLQPSSNAGNRPALFGIEIQEAIVGYRPSIDPNITTLHRVIGFRLQGMDKVGWIEVRSGQYYSPPDDHNRLWYGYLSASIQREVNPCSCNAGADPECLFASPPSSPNE